MTSKISSRPRPVFGPRRGAQRPFIPMKKVGRLISAKPAVRREKANSSPNPTPDTPAQGSDSKIPRRREPGQRQKFIADPNVNLDERNPEWDTAPSMNATAEIRLAGSVLGLALEDLLGYGINQKEAFQFFFAEGRSADLQTWLHIAQVDTDVIGFRARLWAKHGEHLKSQPCLFHTPKPIVSVAAESRIIKDLLSTGPATLNELVVCSGIPRDTVTYVLETLVMFEKVKTARGKYRLVVEKAKT